MDSQSLFREEVAQARNERLHGTVVLSQPISTTVIVGAIVLVILDRGGHRTAHCQTKV